MSLLSSLSKSFPKEKAPKSPTPPIITNKEAVQARDRLNKELKRSDIETNAIPSNIDQPLTILLHGYLSSKWLWIDPYFGTFGWLRAHQQDPAPRDHGWHSTPLPSHMRIGYDIGLSPLINPEGLFNYLQRHDFEILTYSQIDPTGNIDTSAKELSLLLDKIKIIYGERPLVLIGHSRGGLIIRRYMDLMNNYQIKKVITLATPHKGTYFSSFHLLKQPVIDVLNQPTVKKIWDFQERRKIKDINISQMAPNSDFITNLNDLAKNPSIEYISVAGNSPVYTHLYLWSGKRKPLTNLLKIFSLPHVKKDSFEEEEKSAHQEKANYQKAKERSQTHQYHWITYPQKIFSIFEPRKYPEFTDGDGIVSTKSAILDGATRTYTINANHEELAVCKKIKKLILKELKKTNRKIE
jgi:pimeloyl-ACP methyl ester carboxylesterase